MFNLVQNVQFVKSYSINFVQCVQARDILSIALDDVDDVVLACIAFQAQIGIVYFVLF